jgi:hypothetical protein
VSWGGYIPGSFINEKAVQAYEKWLEENPVPFVRMSEEERNNIPMITEPLPNEPYRPEISEPEPFETVPPRGNLLWAAVDLDGTLAESVWTPDNPTTDIGPVKVYPNGKTAKDLVDELYEAGYKVVVHTSRGYTDLENIERWLKHHGIRFRQVVCGKLLAAIYIDDRNKSIWDETWVPERGEK